MPTFTLPFIEQATNPTTPTPKASSKTTKPPETTVAPNTTNQVVASDTDLLGFFNQLQSEINDSSPDGKNQIFIINPLDSYLNTNYKIRLFMINDIDWMTQLKASAGPTPDSNSTLKIKDVFDYIDNTENVIIAESGVTVGYNIKELSILSKVGPDAEAMNANSSRFTMTIEEPLGSSLIENLQSTASALQIKNYSKCWYLLEIMFVGYDEQNNEIMNVLGNQSYDNGGRWLYQVKIATIDTELTSTGSKYVLDLYPYTETPLHVQYQASSVYTISAGGATVGAFFADLATKLNASYTDYYLSSDTFTVDFVCHPDVDSGRQDTKYNPGNFNISPVKKDLEEQRSWSWAGAGDPTMNISAGTSITSIIEGVFSATEEARQLAKDLNKNNSTDEEPQFKTNMDLYRAAKLYRVEPEVTIIGYNPVIEDYKMKVTYHIFGYYTQFPIISHTQIDNAKDTQVQQKMLFELYKRGFFKKRYQYLFTGLNTEVLRCDIKFNLSWVTVLPLLTRALLSTTQDVVAGKKIDRDKINLLRNANNVALEAALLADKAKRDKATPEQIDNSAKTAQLAANTLASIEKTNNYTVAQAIKDSQTLNKQSELSQQQALAATKGKKSIFTEDLSGTVNGTAVSQNTQDLPFQISTRTQLTDVQNNVGVGMSILSGADRSIYGAILEQMYGTVTSGLMQLDMEIRGDPYWLSYSNIERRVQVRTPTGPTLTPNTSLAYYTHGDNTIALDFKFPYQINDDGSELIRHDDKFFGLYKVSEITHLFSGGQFTQNIKAQRMPLHDLAAAAGLATQAPNSNDADKGKITK